MQRTSVSRRSWLRQATALGLAAPYLSSSLAFGRSAADKINIACIGVGGKGESDMLETSVGHNIVAVCDIDEQRLDKAAQRFSGAKKYTDWRKLLEQKDIDAVTVSTPDHTHAPASLVAMALGKHVYTQKPLTHSVHEARQLTRAAAKFKVVTQMGIQHHASSRLKIAVRTIQDGVIGKVREVHTWTDRPGNYWKQGLERPAKSDTPPAHVHWDQWLGVAQARPYVSATYHPFHWRGWWDFGTGALGDMGCHILDPVVNALQLGPPRTVSAEGPAPQAESGPVWCNVHWEFPGTKFTTDSVAVHWYEAGKQPPREIFKAPADWKGSPNGVLYVGEKGNLFVGFPEAAELFPRETFADTKLPAIADHNHYTQWTDAILGKTQTSCPFSYSGPLTETVLLGNVAYRSGQKLQWDSQKLEAVNAPSANQFIRREYRKGWEVNIDV